jgi:predicted nuclease of restriction endonuclease-like (RecB) superfamily
MTKQKTQKSTAAVRTKITRYQATLGAIKERIQEAQLRASILVNKELINLYWFIGGTIVAKQKKDGWGSNTIEQLAKDLQNEFPGIAGFSRSNIFRMRSFARSKSTNNKKSCSQKAA